MKINVLFCGGKGTLEGALDRALEYLSYTPASITYFILIKKKTFWSGKSVMPNAPPESDCLLKTNGQKLLG